MEMSFDAFEYQLKMKKPRAEDALQKWILDADGSLKPETHPDLRVAVGEEEEQEEKGEKKVRHDDVEEEEEGVGRLRSNKKWTVKILEEKKKGGSRMDGQHSFNLIVLMKEKKVTRVRFGEL